MKSFVVSTHSYLLLATVDDNLSATDYQIVNRGYHFGLSVQPAGEGKELCAYYGGVNVHEQTDRKLNRYRYGSNAALTATGSQALGADWHDVHQLAFAEDGLYVTNTGRNQICYLDANGSVKHRYTFGGVNQDINHVNSVFLTGERRLLALLHNKARKESEIAVMRYDPQTGFAIENTKSLWHIGCHNLYTDGRYLIYNASQAHRIVVADLKTSRIAHEIAFEGWHSKGMSVTENHIVVGLSEHTVRDRRAFAESRLAFIDRQRFDVVGVVDVQLNDAQTTAGNINDVRCLSHAEYAQASAVPIDWSRTHLARADILKFWAGRMRLRLELPARRIKQRLTHFTP